jgi:diguanylate cyclase (GGDEF)-like protein/PAS domain S-box-containing protein
MTTVVIVDDQAINLKILSRFAHALDQTVVVQAFERPEVALDFLASSTVDLIVTDYVMPTLNGEDFIRRCREQANTLDVPIIVVTAYEDRQFRYRALDAGASDILLSPVDGREFCTRARNLISLAQHQRALTRRAISLESELAEATRQYAEDIRIREEHLRRVINTVPALIRATDAQGRIIFLNTCHQQFFEMDQDPVGGGVKDHAFGVEYDRQHRDLDRQVVETGQMVVGFEESLVDRQGRERVLLTTKAPLRHGDGRIDQVVTVSLDITKRKRVEQAVRESEERFRSLVEGSVLGIVIERDGIPLFANSTFARIFGYDTPEQILTLDRLDRLFHPGENGRGSRPRPGNRPAAHLEDPIEVECVRQDGAVIWIETLAQAVMWKGESARQLTVVDITLRKAFEERLQRQANFDEITGLPNRVLALDRLRTAVIGAVRHHHKGGVLFVDLDHFKKINDTWGHAAGDHLLRLAAERLRQCVREEDTVARLGGDEFTVILPHIASAAHTEPVVQKILHAFSQPFVLDRHEAFVTASIGVTVFPDDSDDPAVLLQNADVAMYRAKEQGRHTSQHFTPELNQRTLSRMRIEGQMVHALDRRELILHYQPLVEVRSGQLVGAEVLLRWSNPELGLLQPDTFIPFAEESGLIVPIGRSVLESACQQLGAWHRSGLRHLSISVNISQRQLRGKGLVESVTKTLERYGVPPHCLELEITEGCLMHDVGETTAALQALDSLGVRLALDDFGTGYSCLSYLKELPVDTVKIDKSFILNVAADPGNATVVEAIIAMAHRLGIRVIGEGVETEEQLEFIRMRGCDFAQGYYFSPPLSADRFRDWVYRWTQACAQALANEIRA